jgi:hypothetical protein
MVKSGIPLLAERLWQIVPKTAHNRSVRRLAKPEPRGGAACRLVDAQAATLRVVRELRFDVEP